MGLGIFAAPSASAQDTNGNGIPDSWELQYLGNLSHAATDDPGAVGRTLLQSYQQGLSPWPAPVVASGLTAWYRADEGILTDSSSDVTQWTDLSGSGFHLYETMNASQNPLLVSGAMNGAPAVQFNASVHQVLESQVVENLQGGSNDMTVIAVIAPNVAPSQSTSVFSWGNGNNGNYGLIGGGNAFCLNWSDPSGNGQNTQSINATAGQPQVYSEVKGGTSASAYLNGALQGTNTVSAAMAQMSSLLTIGNASITAYGYNGEIAEVLVYNRALSDSERQSVEAALKAKYIAVDSNNNGIPDTWELQYLGNLSHAATDDPGAVGRTLLQSYQQGLSPWPAPVVASGLTAWYRADEGILTDSSSDVTQWTDLSGSGFHLYETMNASQNPLLVSGAMNGAPAVQFNASVHQVLESQVVENLQGGSNDMTVIAVIAPNVAPSQSTSVFSWGNGNNGNYGLIGGGNAFCLNWSDPSGNGQNTQSINATAGQPQVYSEVKGGTSASAYLNGALQGTNTVSAAMAQMSSLLTIGNASITAYGYNGEIAEVLVYNRALSDSERQSVEAALKAKYIAVDSNNNGIPDTWELQYLGNLSHAATDDPGAVGRTLLQSYQQGLSPWPAPVVASGLTAWYRADEGILTDSSSDVTQWTDLSGSGFHLYETMNASQNPLLVSGAMNGAPAVQFNASVHQVLESQVVENLQGGSNDMTVIAVIAPNVAPSQSTSVFSWGNGNNGNYGLIGGGNAFCLNWSDPSGNGQNTQSINATAGQPQVYSEVKGGTSASAYLNGALQGTNTVSAAMAQMSSLLTIGNASITAYGYNGEIAEVLVYNRALSDSERQSVEAALKAKYIAVDSNNNGIPDTWELQYLGNLSHAATDDPGAVGRTLLQSYQQGLSPWPAPVVASGLTAWYRADEGILTDSSSDVTQWTDLSGSGFHLYETMNASQNPLLVSGAMNGAPAVQFNASVHQVLESQVVENLQGGSNDMTVIAVIAPNVAPSQSTSVFSWGNGNNGNYGLIGGGNAFCLNWSDPSGNGQNTQSINATAGQPQVYSEVKGGTSASAYLNGALQGTNTVSAAMAQMSSLLTIGNASITAYGYNGEIAEVLVYNRALSDSERQSVEAALKAKYIAVDSNNNGIPDTWELQYLGNLSHAATDDPGAVGRTLLQSYQQGLSPWPAPVVASGLTAWYRADEGVVTNSSGQVTQWTDVSGNAVHITPTTDMRRAPTLAGGSVNGMPSVVFDGNLNALTTTIPVNLVQSGTDFTVFFVVNPAATQGGPVTLLDGSYPVNQAFSGTDTFDFMWADSQGNGYGGGNVSLTPGVSQIYEVRKSGSQANSYLNGQLESPVDIWWNSSPNVNSTPKMLTLGGANNLFQNFGGQIAEVLIYNRALSDTERQSVESALTSKYGLADANANGIPDTWEMQYLGNLSHAATDDPGGVGRTLLQSYQQGLSPWPAPDVASGLQAWFRSDLGLVVGTNGTVSQWTDISGNAVHVIQPDPTREPTSTAQAMNGEPAVSFDGSRSILQTEGLVNLMQGAGDVSLIVVMQPGSQTGNISFVDYGGYLRAENTTAGTNEYNLMWQDSSGNFYGSGGLFEQQGAPQIYEVIKSGADAQSFLNGALQSDFTISWNPTPSVATVSQPFTLGAMGNSLANYDGQIAEVLVYNRALTTTERQAIETQLMAKYVPADSNGNGIPDAWEMQYLGNLSYLASDDPGGLGRTLLQSYQQGLSPWPTPTISSGLQAWYRADLGLVTDASGNVSQWTDVSGNAVHVVQPDTTKQPSAVPSAMNGAPAVEFDGASSDLQSAAAANLLKNSNETTVIMVMAADPNQTAGCGVLDYGAPSLRVNQAQGAPNEFGEMWFDPSGNPFGFGETSPQPTTAQILDLIKSPEEGRVFLNGQLVNDVQLETNSGGDPEYLTGNLPFTIGSYGNQLSNYHGQIAEILVYNRALSESERQSVEAALLAKYVEAPGPQITSPATTTGTVGTAFSYQITASGSPGSFTATGLPPGLTLGSDGLICGTPTEPGSTTVTLGATNDGGTGNESLVISVMASLPYLTGFEASEGYTAGSISGQLGWVVSQGSAAVTTQTANTGTQSMVLQAGSAAAVVSQPIAQRVNEGIVFCDFYAIACAETSIASSTIFTAEGARFGFIQSGGQGVLQVFNGNGSGGGTWSSVNFTSPINGVNQTTSWVRLTARLDFTKQTWDMYANGNMVAADIPFTSSSTTYFSSFGIQGDPNAASYVDDVYVAPTNPLFADVNNDGISDAWETQYGLSLATNDRYGDPSGGGITNVQKYIDGTNPNDFYNGVLPVLTSLVSAGQLGSQGLVAVKVTRASDGTAIVNAPVTLAVTTGASQIASQVGGTAGAQVTVQTNSQGIASAYVTFTSVAPDLLVATATSNSNSTSISIPIDPSIPTASMRLWLRADMGVQTATGNAVSQWQDQSGDGNNATQSSSSSRPVLVSNALNGLPAIQFTASSSQFFSLPAVMSGASSGEVFVILKTTSATPTTARGVWALGSSGADSYCGTDGNIHESFGSNFEYNIGHPGGAGDTQFSLYNVQAEAGKWTAAIDGLTLLSSSTNTVSFSTSSGALGHNGNSNYFDGEIAEVIAYGQVLSAQQRAAVEQYLALKYSLPGVSAPANPASLTAMALSPGEVSLAWSEAPMSAGITYTIWREVGSGGFSAVAQVNNALSYVDSGLATGASYTYQISSSTLAGNSPGFSNQATATTLTSGSDMPLSGMRLWLKADGGVQVTSGGAVIQWQDQSLSGNNAVQDAVANEPALLASAIGGRPAVGFTASSSQFFGLPAVMSGASAGEEFIVLMSNSATPANPRGIWNLGSNATDSYPGTDGNIHESFGTTGSGQYNIGHPAGGVTQFSLYNVHGQSGQWAASVDGVTLLSSTSNSVSFNTSSGTLGRNANSNNFDGQIAEIIVYGSVLTPQQRATVDLYLESKYSLPGISVPPNPTSLSATPLSGTQISLGWSDIPTSTGITYTIWRQSGGGAFAAVGQVANALSYIDTGLTPGTAYSYEISSTTLAGSSPGFSNVATATTLSGGTDLPFAGMKLWLKADSGVVAAPAGGVIEWQDQSGNGNNAVQNSPASEPVLLAGGLNGLPTVKFTASSSQYFTLPLFMSGATAGEAFIVVKAASATPTTTRGLWSAGPNATDGYPGTDGNIHESFGTTGSTQYNIGRPTGGINQFGVYDIYGESGAWGAFMDGIPLFASLTNTVGFNTNTLMLGKNGNSNPFDGQIAEIIVYNQVLSSQQRVTIGQYLQDKYNLPGVSAPAIPTGLTAAPISNTEVSLTWTASLPSAGEIFTLWRQTGTGAYVEIAQVTDGFSYVDTGLTAGTAYNYEISATTLAGTSALSTATVTAETPNDAVVPTSGMTLWLKGYLGIQYSSTGTIQQWSDQSNSGHNATQTTSGLEPTLVGGALNGLPVVHFSGGQQLVLGNYMSGAGSGEVFAVVRASGQSNHFNGLWSLGGSAGAFFPSTDGTMTDDFGSNQIYSTGLPAVSLSGFNIYNVSAQAGSWVSRLNGAVHYTSASNSVVFGSGANIGTADGQYFTGDIAEVIVYNRVLSAAERASVGSALTQKYALPIGTPSPPSSVTANPVSSNQVALTWQGDPSNNVGVTYTIERSVAGGAYTPIGTLTDSYSYFDATAAPGTAYTYEIQASTYAGTSTSNPTPVVTTPASASAMPTTGLRMWLSADTGVTNASNGAVTQWFDQGPNANIVTQVTVGSSPFFTPSQINGRPTVHFYGGNQQLVFGTLMTGAAGGELFIVARSTANSGTLNGIYTLGGANGSYFPSSDGTIQDDFGSTTTYSTGLPPVSVAGFSIYNVTSQAGSWVSRFNGATHYSSTANTVSYTSNLKLGVGGFRSFMGDVAEVLIYDHALATADRTTVTAYLTQKYGIGIPAPTSPTQLTAAAISSTQTLLTWAGPSNVASGVTYSVLRSMNGSAYSAVGSVTDTYSYFDTGLTAGATYTYQIVAATAGGSSPASASAAVVMPASAPDMPMTGIRLWLAADEGVSTDASGDITQWKDQGPNGYVISQATLGQQPQLSANAFNGRPVVHFSGGQTLPLPNFMANATAGEVFVMVRASSAARAFNGLWALGGQNGAYFPSADGTISDDFGSSQAYSEIAPTVPIDEFVTYNVSAQSGSWVNRINGFTQFSSSTNTPVFSSSPALGNGGFHDLTGDIAEMIVYDHVLSDTDRATVQTYLNDKYRSQFDSNGDGIPDGQAIALGLNPFSPDTTGDGISDAWKVKFDIPPLVPDTSGNLSGDGILDFTKYQLDLNPTLNVSQDPAAPVQLLIFFPPRN